jgi:hypothetical protein
LDGEEAGQSTNEHQRTSLRQSRRVHKSSIPHGLQSAGKEAAKPRKPRGKSLHAPYQKLKPIFTDHTQDVDMEASDCVTLSVSNLSCADVPVSIVSLLYNDVLTTCIALRVLHRCGVSHMDMHRAREAL